MKKFRAYYKNQFRHDINHFIATIPKGSKFHFPFNSQDSIKIQFDRLSGFRTHLDFLAKEEKEFFGVALFFTVLVDMVCYTYYQEHYDKFRKLTQYSKLIGSCPCGCLTHLHPKNIFKAMNQDLRNNEDKLFFKDKFNSAIDVMKKETLVFLMYI